MLDSLFIVAVLGANVALAEWLARRSFLRHLGSALLVIVLTAIAANTGLIPTYADDIPVYAGVFEHLAPMAIFLLLLRVNLRGMLQAGTAMLLLFALGAAGTVAGVAAGLWAVGGSGAFGALGHALGGMFVGPIPAAASTSTRSRWNTAWSITARSTQARRPWTVP